MDLLKNALGLGQNIGEFFKKKKDEFVDFVTPDPQKRPSPQATPKFTMPKMNFTLPKVAGIDIGKTFQYYTGQTPKSPKIEAMNRQSVFNPANMAKSWQNAKAQAGTQDPLQAVIYHGKQAAAELPKTFPNYVRQTSEQAFGPTWGRIIAAPTANTAQAMSQGAIDMYKGGKKLLGVPELIKNAKYGEAAGQTFEGGTKALFGGAKAVAASTPLFQVFNVVSGMDNELGRFGRGFVRGMSGEKLDPNAPKKNIEIGQVEFDPLETAGEMVGFVKNPAWKRIFPVTSQILKANPTSMPVANFIFQRVTKGGLEGYLQAVGNMPDKMTEQEKWKVIKDNVLFGAGAELGFDILGQGANALKNQKLAVRLMDTLSNEWRRANIPVLDWKTGERIPMWKYRLKDQKGEIDLDAKIENPLKDIGKAPNNTPIVGIDDMIQKTKDAVGTKPQVEDAITSNRLKIIEEPYYGKKNTDDGGFVRLTDEKGKSLGTVEYFMKGTGKDRRGIIHLIEIDDEIRGKGIGSSLLKRIEDMIRQRGGSVVKAQSVSNPEFFGKKGYTESPQDGVTTLMKKLNTGGIKDLADVKARLMNVAVLPESDKIAIQNAKTSEDLAPYLRKLEGGSLAKFFNSGAGQVRAADKPKVKTAQEIVDQVTTGQWTKNGQPILSPDGSPASMKTLSELSKEYKTPEEFINSMKGMSQPDQVMQQFKSEYNPKSTQDVETALRDVWNKNNAQTTTPPLSSTAGVTDRGEVIQGSVKPKTAQEIVQQVQEGVYTPPNPKNMMPEPPQGKQRGFIESVKTSPNTAPEVARGVEGTYDPITNPETMKRAQEMVKNNYDQAVAMVKSDGPLTADDSAVAQQLISRAQREGRMEDAISIVEKIAERATTAGQGIQALSMWNKLGPDGILLYTTKLFKKTGEQQGILDKMIGRKPPEMTKEFAETITKMAEDIQTMEDPEAKKNATKALLELISSNIPQKVSSMIDEFRYNNILSSPRTHIVNIFSNAIQAGILKPATRLAEGGIDFARATLTGDKERRVFASEVPVYYQGMLGKMGEATNSFLKAVRGEMDIERPDLSRGQMDALVKPPSSLPTALTIPSKLLEGMDRFWMTLLKGGEEAALTYRKGRGVDVGDIQAKAEMDAKYYTFRQAVDPSGKKTGQGNLLRSIDQFTKGIYTLRKVPGIGWFIPFVQTPMNITKQMIEYSPAGIATLPGAKNKAEQLAKTLVGTTAMTAAATLVSNLETTWSAPTGKKEKELFYASGRQPYSIKVGDSWVAINQLGPLSAAFVIPMAFKESFKGDNRPTDTQLQNIGQAILKVGKYLSDQTYVKGIGDFVKMMQGDEVGAGQFLTNIPRQLIPMSSLLSWAARIIDPIMRNPGKDVGANIAAGLPFLSKLVEPFTDPTGEPSRAPNPLINAISPMKIGEVRDFFEPFYQRYKQNQYEDREARALKAEKDKLQGKGESGGFKIGQNGEIGTSVSGDLGKYAKMYGFDKYIGESKSTGIKKFQEDDERISVARKIFAGEDDYEGIPDDIKEEALKAMGLEPKQVEYDYMANQKDDVKSSYIASQFEETGASHEDILTVLQSGRVQSISGKMIVSDGVLDDLYEAGYISYDERKYLKKIKLTEKGELTKGAERATGGGSGTQAKDDKKLTAMLKKAASASDTRMSAPPKIDTIIATTKSNVKPAQIKPIDVDVRLSSVKLPNNKPPTVEELIKAAKIKATPENISKARELVARAKMARGGETKTMKLSRSSYRGGARK